MTEETLKKAITLKNYIDFLENKIKVFNPDRRNVYLHTKDHHGNERDIIETYAFGDSYGPAAGTLLQTIIPDAYAEFLTTVRDAMQKRINELKKQLEDLN